MGQLFLIVFIGGLALSWGTAVTKFTAPTTEAATTAHLQPEATTVPVLANYECSANGNTFRVVPDSRCKNYTQEAAGSPPQLLTCGPNTRFDTTKCTCNWEQDMKCPGYDDCVAFGNLFVVVPDSDCRSYTIASANSPPQQLPCPPLTRFDTMECTGNFEDKVFCAKPLGSNNIVG